MSESLPADIWRFVTGKERAIAGHLRSLIPVLPRSIGQRVSRAALEMERIDKLGGVGDSSVQQNALADIDLVAILSPLLERTRADDNDNAFEEADLVADLQIGVSRLVRCSGQGNGIVGLFVYPGLLLVGSIGVLLLFSRMILPNFRTVLNEFGIELPEATKAMFSVGIFFQSAWPLALFVAVLAAVPMMIELCRCMGVAMGFVQWGDDKIASKRSVMGRWARHTALLLQVGINEDAAIKASMSSAKRWMRSGAWPWRFGLVEQTLKLDDTTAKINLLNDVADYYRARHRSVIQWWASFLPTIVICVLGALVAFLMLSILMPLVSIITGLSGF